MNGRAEKHSVRRIGKKCEVKVKFFGSRTPESGEMGTLKALR
jgi:hypothetical protein